MDIGIYYQQEVLIVYLLKIFIVQNPLDFSSWKPPTGWSVTNPLAAPLIAPSAEDQNVSPANWHPDTKAIVEGNKTAVKSKKYKYK